MRVFVLVSLVMLLAGLSLATDNPRPEPDLVKVKVSTSYGDFVVELDAAKAPISVKNFLAYVDSGFFEGTIFHRVIPSFMIQGGGFTADMKKKPTQPPIKNEWTNGLKNLRGTIAMARIGRQPDSATSQFFINVVDNPGLDQPNDGAGYAVFGKVVEGMTVVDKIRNIPTHEPTIDGMPFKDVPVETVVIKKMSRITHNPPAEKK